MSHNTQPKLFKTALFTLAVALVASTAAFAQSAFSGDRGEQFSANLVDPNGHFGRRGASTAPILIHIDRYSSDTEVQQLSGVLAQKGPEALREALWNQEVGYIRVGGGLGYPIAAARSKDTPDGRVVRIMIDRPIASREVLNDTFSVDYPFSYIEIKLDANGKGDGQFFAAAKVSLKEGTLKVESFSPQPLRLLGVQAH
jgi:hypothetical protein